MPKAKPMNAMISERAPDAEAPHLPAGWSLHHVSFFCEAREADRIFLVGNFNHWNPTVTPMNRMPDGRWMASLELPHGHHQYCFLVDGEPQLDPKASGVTRNDRNEPASLIAVS
jgi:1,4-alpha-glucan branching enzyme